MQPQRPASSLIPSLPPSRSWDAGRAGQRGAGGVPQAKFAAACPNPAAHGPTASPGARPRAQGGRTQQGQPEASWRSCSQHHSTKIPPQRLGQATATSGAPVATHLASLAGPHAAKASRVLLVSRSWPLSLPSGDRHPAGTRRTIFAARQLRLLPPHAYLMSAIILLSAHGGELTFLVRGWGGAGMRGGQPAAVPVPAPGGLGHL